MARILPCSFKRDQRLQSVVVVQVFIRTMEKVDVEIVGAQAAQALLDLALDGDARIVEVLTSTGEHAHLRRQHHLVTPSRNGAANNLLTAAVSVYGRGIDVVDAELQRPQYRPPRLSIVHPPIPVAAHPPRPQPHFRDAYTRPTQRAVLHVQSSQTQI